MKPCYKSLKRHGRRRGVRKSNSDKQKKSESVKQGYVSKQKYNNDKQKKNENRRES